MIFIIKLFRFLFYYLPAYPSAYLKRFLLFLCYPLCCKELKLVKRNDNKFLFKNHSISVVIPTKNGLTRGIKKLLQSLENQTAKINEIIVIDSGSSDGTQNYLKKRGVIVIDNSTKEFSHSQARNLGASKAKSEFILFTVDDAVFYDPHWIEKALEFINTSSELVSISGIQVSNQTKDLFSMFKSKNHVHMLRKKIKCNSVIKIPDFILKIFKIFNIEFIYAPIDNTNHLVKRDFFLKNKFKIDTVEDLEFSSRVILSGKSIVFLFDLEISHGHLYNKNQLDSYIKRLALDFLIFKNNFKYGPFNNLNDNELSYLCDLIFLLLKQYKIVEIKKFHFRDLIVFFLKQKSQTKKINFQELRKSRLLFQSIKEKPSSSLNVNYFGIFKCYIFIFLLLDSIKKSILKTKHIDKASLRTYIHYYSVTFLASCYVFSTKRKKNVIMDNLTLADWI